MKKALLIVFWVLFNGIFISSQAKPQSKLTFSKNEPNYENLINDFFGELEYKIGEVESAIKLTFALGLFFAKKYVDEKIFEQLIGAAEKKLGSSDQTKKILNSIKLENKTDSFVNSLGKTLDLDLILTELGNKKIKKDEYINSSVEVIDDFFLTNLGVTSEHLTTTAAEIKNVLGNLKIQTGPEAPATVEEKQSTGEKILDKLADIGTDPEKLIILVVFLSAVYYRLKGKITSEQMATAMLMTKMNPELGAASLASGLSENGETQAAKQFSEISTTVKTSARAGSIAKKLAARDEEGAMQEATQLLVDRTAQNKKDLQYLEDSADVAEAVFHEDIVATEKALEKVNIQLSPEEQKKLDASFKSTLSADIKKLQDSITRELQIEMVDSKKNKEVIDRLNDLKSKVTDLSKLEPAQAKSLLDSYNKTFSNTQDFSRHLTVVSNYQNRLIDLFTLQSVKNDPATLNKLSELSNRMQKLREDMLKTKEFDEKTKRDIEDREKAIDKDIRDIEAVKKDKK